MDVHTARIGVVRSYSSLTQRADVQPIGRVSVRGEGDERVVETMPTQHGVPVAFLASSNSSDTFDLERGDTVLLVFCEHSLDQWLGGATGVDEPLDPGDDRMHSLSDAIAIPIRIRLPLPALPGARVVNSSDIRLGGPAALEAVVRGSTYRSAENALLTLFKAAFSAIAADPAVNSATDSACTAAATGIDTFKLANASYLSTKVRVE